MGRVVEFTGDRRCVLAIDGLGEGVRVAVGQSAVEDRPGGERRVS